MIRSTERNGATVQAQADPRAVESSDLLARVSCSPSHVRREKRGDVMCRLQLQMLRFQNMIGNWGSLRSRLFSLSRLRRDSGRDGSTPTYWLHEALTVVADRYWPRSDDFRASRSRFQLRKIDLVLDSGMPDARHA